MFLHEASRALLVTDLALSIPREPPEVISRERLLNVAPDDPKDAPAADTPENLRTGWAKASLVVSFLGPARQAQVEEGAFKGKLRWEPGYERSFDAVADRVAPSPILRTLVFSKGRAATRRFLDELERDWGGGRREEGGAVDGAADEANERREAMERSHGAKEAELAEKEDAMRRAAERARASRRGRGVAQRGRLDLSGRSRRGRCRCGGSARAARRGSARAARSRSSCAR